MNASQWHLGDIVTQLKESREITHNIRHRGLPRHLPSPVTIAAILDGLSSALFPTHFGPADLQIDGVDRFVEDTLATTLLELADQIRRSLRLTLDDTIPASEAADRIAQDITREFAFLLPDIRAQLVGDLQAAFEGDPAATTMPEILLGYPGMIATMYYRLARALYLLGAPLVARLISRIAHSRTAIDIHPGADIGERFFIDHGTGLVIGETAVVGKRVCLHQAVTLGAKRLPSIRSGGPVKGPARHPIVEDDVVIYAGATILGRITIGRGSTIGGNVCLTQSVPPKSNISQVQMRKE
jgi:serine O-acetyltransferase